jgi:Adenylate and Guanylate cyclase catalytic domain
MPVAQKLISGSFEYLAELREVTTMFMSWDSYDDVIHNDLLALQTHFLIAEKILAESGGFIRQFLIDDKGCVLIACWGVPTASHPDNTRRALCAGAIIGNKLNEIGMKTSVGITTGNVFCGSVGSYVRREYAVIGDVVNLAARLMSKAKGGLFIDEATYDRIPAHLQRHLEKLPPIAVKGKDELVTPYSLKSGVGRLSLEDKGVNEKHIDALTIRSICKIPLLEGMRRIQKKVPVNLRFVIIEGKTGTEKHEVLEWLKLTGSEMDVRILNLRLSCKDKLSDYHLAKSLFRLLVGAEVFDDVERQQIMIKNLLRKVYRKDKETIGKVQFYW